MCHVGQAFQPDTCCAVVRLESLTHAEHRAIRRVENGPETLLKLARELDARLDR